MTPLSGVVLASDCLGLWQRTLLIEADGSRDTKPGVTWLQGVTAYVDSRGFAGRLDQNDNAFWWHRMVDLEPPGPHPDVGAMDWQDGVLVETGVYEDYVEHWVRDDGGATPCGALFMVAPNGSAGLLLRVGDRFGWAGGDEVVIDLVDGPRWKAMEFRGEHIRRNGVSWTVEDSEGNVNP